MRTFDEAESLLLHVAELFGRVEKYQGVTPEEHILFFDDKAKERLLEDGILEKVKLRSFGHRVKGLRFTAPGLAAWRDFRGEEHPPHPTAMDNLVRDVFYLSRVSFLDRAVSKKQILRFHSRSCLHQAFDLGLVAKVKLHQADQEVVKGYVVTNAGYAYLRGNQMI